MTAAPQAPEVIPTAPVTTTGSTANSDTGVIPVTEGIPLVTGATQAADNQNAALNQKSPDPSAVNVVPASREMSDVVQRDDNDHIPAGGVVPAAPAESKSKFAKLKSKLRAKKEQIGLGNKLINTGFSFAKTGVGSEKQNYVNVRVEDYEDHLPKDLPEEEKSEKVNAFRKLTNKCADKEYFNWDRLAVPAVSTLLGGYGTFNAIKGAKRKWQDHNKKMENASVGGSRWDSALSGFDAANSTVSAITSTWNTGLNTAKLIGGIGFAAGGGAGWDHFLSGVGSVASVSGRYVVPGINIATGAVDIATGAAQWHRSRMAMKELDKSKNELRKMVPTARPVVDGADPQPVGQKKDQQKMKDIMKQGRRVAKLNKGSEIFKTAQGVTSFASAVTTITGAGAPVGAALTGVSATLSAAKFAFEHGYKRRIQKKALAKEYHIDWDQELKDVEAMIHEYNPNFDVMDKYKRAIILRAHGHGDDKTELGELTNLKSSFQAVTKKRAKYLMNTAKQEGTPRGPASYQEIAEKVILGMGIHKRGPIGQESFVDGAEELLAEKLGA